ncbi:response regulator [Candidatus Peregrinibacteria bacterium]|nr:MAG: response regulator [Candidatus Peregrinibacteria bacterium]
MRVDTRYPSCDGGGGTTAPMFKPDFDLGAPNPRILLIEDQHGVADMIRRTLRHLFSAAQIDEAHDLSGAMALLGYLHDSEEPVAVQPYQLVVSDVNIEGEDAPYSWLPVIADIIRRQLGPVLVVTGGMGSEQMKAADLSRGHIRPKTSLRPRTLAEWIKELLEQPSRPWEPRYLDQSFNLADQLWNTINEQLIQFYNLPANDHYPHYDGDLSLIKDRLAYLAATYEDLLGKLPSDASTESVTEINKALGRLRLEIERPGIDLHDINNVLAALFGNWELLQDELSEAA